MKVNHKLEYDVSGQSGRSMVEMLSVVSIIGILTVAGFAGYSVLMEKHRNNQRIQGTTVVAMGVSAQMLAGVNPTIDKDKKVVNHQVGLVAGHASTTWGYDAANAYEATENVGECIGYECVALAGDEDFALELTDVSSDVCNFFVQFSSDLGLVTKVTNEKGEDLSKIGCGEFKEKNEKVYLVYKSDLALTRSGEAKEIVKDSLRKELCSDHGEFGANNTTGCVCDKGWTGNGCSEEGDNCSGHGQTYSDASGTIACICEENYTGSRCEEMLAFSPCQTLTIENGKEVRGFKPAGTDCTQAGIQSRCDDRGHCVPIGGKQCKGASDCLELGHDYFCNYGGHMGDYQKGGTPDVCEKVNPETFEFKGATFYHNNDKDLRSWCRAADGGPNCTWGFLSYYGAQSWCESLGTKLVDAEFIRDNCDEFKKHLPQVAPDQQYWVANQSVVHLGDNCSIQPMSRTDGYAAAAGVVCIKGEPENPDTPTPGIGGGGAAPGNWIRIEGCKCDEKRGISLDSSDELCNIQCCLDKHNGNGYVANKTCCQYNDDDCICKANGCKTGSSATPLDYYCCAREQGLL